MPTQAEAVLLSEVRREVAEAVGLSIAYDEPDTILDRYAHLMAARSQQQAEARGRDARTAPMQGEVWGCTDHVPEKRAANTEVQA
jgi:hypothetical protein